MRVANKTEPTDAGGETASPDEVVVLDTSWRAASFLGAAQIDLRDNVLLERLHRGGDDDHAVPAPGQERGRPLPCPHPGRPRRVADQPGRRSGGRGDRRPLRAKAGRRLVRRRSPRRRPARDYHVRKYLGAYAAALGGMDAIALSGALAENSVALRGRVLSGLELLGIRLDEGRNRVAGPAAPARISADGSAVPVWVVPADQARQMAREVAGLSRDEEMIAMVKKSTLVGFANTVRIAAGRVTLAGNLSVPAGARGLVLFAHGSGSSRHSPRNRHVAGVLQEAGLGTLLIDLLTSDEEAMDVRTAHLRFDIGRLAERLVGATDWLAENPDTQGLKVGYFGASTGGGAALVAAADRPDRVGAVVSRGGRPDLAGPSLLRVRAPTLLIVGGRDIPVIAMNREALMQLRSEKRLEIVPGATHLFEEPGALEVVARLAERWFRQHLMSDEVV